MPTKDKQPTEGLVEAVEAPRKPSRGRGGRDNFPQSTAGIAPEAIRKAMREVMQAYRMPRVTSDDEFLDRISLYFEVCIERGSHPVIEELALFCGYTTDGLLEIQSGKHKGFSTKTASIIKKAKFCVQSLDAKLASTGDLPFLVYCFRAKNYYGMQDKVEHVLTPGNQQEEYDRETIMKRYMLEDGSKTKEEE